SACCGSSRSLPSFPTRRSSDLRTDHVSIHRGVADRGLALVSRIQYQCADLIGQRHQDDAADPRLEILRGEASEFASERTGEGVEDRKSTRLNSSHVKISYAVFC